ncbi:MULTISPECIES: IS66 family insertion sequence element accessory protein TnpB [unclassified Pseudomonas]|uniref:IS66 family insertion sequence element accessory protein TnpB n=1 Tax=unclassified Pseudomonas TaxID=196821 RepID=UPI0015B64A2A
MVGGGTAKQRCTYLFANRRATRMKVLVRDGLGIWLAARRLNQGKSHCPGIHHGFEMELDTEQLKTRLIEQMIVCRVASQWQTGGGDHESDPVGTHERA